MLAVVFATAGVAKLLDRPGSRQALAGFGVPEWALPIGVLALPLAEIAIAIALVPADTARWSAVAALVLLVAFIAGIASALSRGQAPDCHCFGQIHSSPAGRGTLARNGVLAALAGAIVVEGPGPAIGTWVADRTPTELVAVATSAAAVILGALAIALWIERRDLRGELAKVRAQLARFPSGLPVGAAAPDFALPDLYGQVHTLESLRATGLPLMLFFVSPNCGPCGRVLGEVGRWQRALSDRLTIAVISQGTSAQNRPVAQEHGITSMLLQQEAEVLGAYRLAHTPSALAVTAQGAIDSQPAEGVLPIEPLIRVTLRRNDALGGAAATGHHVA